MSGEKRSASEAFGSTQLVKRQRSDSNINGSALTQINGGGSGSALIQGVYLTHSNHAKQSWSVS
jgi:Prp8 binding protein